MKVSIVVVTSSPFRSRTSLMSLIAFCKLVKSEVNAIVPSASIGNTTVWVGPDEPPTWKV